MLTYLRTNLGWLADVASLVGLAITFVGFAATIWNVRKTKRAAEEARRTAGETLRRLAAQVLTSEIAAAVLTVSNIEVACREQQWPTALEGCNEVRAQLSRIQDHPKLTLKQA